MKSRTTLVSVTNGEGVTITAEQTHGDVGASQGMNVAQFTVTNPEGTISIGFRANRENRRRLRALIDMMDL